MELRIYSIPFRTDADSLRYCHRRRIPAKRPMVLLNLVCIWFSAQMASCCCCRPVSWNKLVDAECFERQEVCKFIFLFKSKGDLLSGGNDKSTPSAYYIQRYCPIKSRWCVLNVCMEEMYHGIIEPGVWVKYFSQTKADKWSSLCSCPVFLPSLLTQIWPNFDSDLAKIWLRIWSSFGSGLA